MWTAEELYAFAMKEMEVYQPYSDSPEVKRVIPTAEQAREYVDCALMLHYYMEGRYPEGVERLSDEDVQPLFEKEEKFKEMALDMRDIVFSVDGKYGLRRITGEVIVPALFDEIPERYNYVFEIEETWGYCRCIPVVRNHKYALCKMDGKGTLVTDFVYDKIFRYFGSRVNFFVVMRDGKKGVIYQNGDEAVPCEMDEVYEMQDWDGIIPYKKDGKWGLFYSVATEPIYDDIIIQSEWYAQVKKDDTWYYLDYEGNPVTDVKDAFFASYYDSSK